MDRWQATVTDIPSGAAGTERTLQAMEGLVAASRRHPLVVRVAQQAVSRVREYDAMGEFQACLDEVRRRTRYTQDPLDCETVKAPWVLIEESEASPTKRAAADCDDQVTLLAALIGCVGYPTRFVTYRADGRRPGDFSHVALEAMSPTDGWVTLDPIMRAWPAGKSVPLRDQYGPVGMGSVMDPAAQSPAVPSSVFAFLGLAAAWAFFKR